MSLRGDDFLSEDIADSLFRFVQRLRLLGVHDFLSDTAAANLGRVLATAGVGPKHVDQHVAVLRGAAAVWAWNDYWAYWRAFPARMERRPARMYVALFKHTMATQHADFCRHVIVDNVGEMGLELPPVELAAGVARAVMECIKVAAPQYKALGEGETSESLPFRGVWNRCVRGLGEPPEDEGDGMIRVVDMDEYADDETWQLSTS